MVNRAQYCATIAEKNKWNWFISSSPIFVLYFLFYNHTGTIRSRNPRDVNMIVSYTYHEKCTWILHVMKELNFNKVHQNAVRSAMQTDSGASHFAETLCIIFRISCIIFRISYMPTDTLFCRPIPDFDEIWQAWGSTEETNPQQVSAHFNHF